MVFKEWFFDILNMIFINLLIIYFNYNWFLYGILFYIIILIVFVLYNMLVVLLMKCIRLYDCIYICVIDLICGVIIDKVIGKCKYIIIFKLNNW